MIGPVIKTLTLAAVIASVPLAALAHKLVVFASTDCASVLVEAKFSNGRIAQKGEVRVLDGANDLLTTLELTDAGTAQVPMADLDTSQGLVIEVDTGGHDNYWILTPEDIARACKS